MKLFAASMVIAMLLVPAAALAGPSIVGNFQGWDPADPTTEVTLIRTAVIRMPGTMPPSSSRPIDTSLMKPNRISPMLGGIVCGGGWKSANFSLGNSL